MVKLKGGLSGLLLGLSLINGVASRRVNNTIYDTNTAHITYAPQEDFCVQWKSFLFWERCSVWAKPWESAVYRSQGKVATLHRSLDHEQPTMTIKFQGSSVWIYGPPRSQLTATPVDHKICLYENHRVASDTVCYRVDVAEAYSLAEDYDAPVVIFAKGGLQDQEHQLVVSVGDPVDEVDRHRGIQFSHAVYTIERPTPWPADEDSWRFREVVMHDTHPLLTYWPKEPVSSGLWPWSSDLSGWFRKTATDKDGSRVSWHELRSQGESTQDKWGIDVTVTAGVVVLYGAPRAHITETDSLSNICVQVDSGPCEIVDVKNTYLSVENHHEAVLLWRNQGLDPYQRTHISIRLVKSGGNNLKIFPFKSIHYFEQQEYSSPDPPVGQVEDITIAHDDQAVVYHPGRRCLNYVAWWCTNWFDPWTWKEAGPSESVLTYRSTVSSYRATEDPSITLDFQGSAVYVYGAPKSFMKDGFASQRVCINDACHIVDVEQAYLNALEAVANVRSLDNTTTLSAIHPDLDPVLIWSMTGLDDKAQHSLRLALAELPSNDNAEMSIARVVYTKVTYGPGQSRPDTPVPPDRTYEGPLYPPHAIEWVPQLPPTPPVLPPHQSPSGGRSSSLAYALWPVLALVFFFICAFLTLSHASTETPERRPIRPRTPPPPYVPGPPPRPAPRPVRPNPPRPRPFPALPVVPPVSPYPNPKPTNPHTSRPDPSIHKPSKPIQKVNSVIKDTAIVPPNPSIKPRVQPSPMDQNNLGPGPGFNIASPKPEYTANVQKPRVSRQEPSHASSSAAPAQNAAIRPLPSAYEATHPDHCLNHSTPHAASSSSVISPVTKHTGPTIRVAESSSQVRDNRSRQPPPVPPVPQPSAKQSTSNNSSTQVKTTKDATRHFQRAVQPAPTPVAPSARTQPQVAPKPLQPPIVQQIGQPSATHRPELPSSNPQESAYTPALNQWAEGQGFRIDRLMRAAREEHSRP
ncbi:unnamed protein product, partial [Rhizoctonia solani]